MSKLPEYWDKYLSISSNRKASQKNTEKKAKEWLELYLKNGYIPLLPEEALKLPDYLFALFYTLLLKKDIKGKALLSPVSDYRDSSWMCDSDFCFLNVRAVGLETAKPGTFMDALKLLVLLRVNSIHLAPFFNCVFGNVYAVDSLSAIASEVIDKNYKDMGLKAENQLRIFIDAIHALGMTVGFDLEPHTSQFSRVVLTYPEYFRWIELARNRKGLANELDQDTMLLEANQKIITNKVKKIVQDHLGKASIENLENDDSQKSTEVHSAIISELVKKGIWTIPSHTWGGVGLPEFSIYNDEYNYPEFEYLDRNGEDQSGHAFGMLTPVKFSTKLNVNTMPTHRSHPVPWQKGIDFFSSIFPQMQKKYGFDYVRIDYVDHVFDSVLEGTSDIPVSDRCTPVLLKNVILQARKAMPYTGALAERMGYDFKDYGSVGFDLILGGDMVRDIDVNFIKSSIDINRQLSDYNSSFSKRISIQFAVDSHDTGHPEINSNPARFGWKGMFVRYFLSRFTNCGKGRRPKYEVIGNQDLTSGLYEANNKPVSLKWENNKEFFTYYNSIEDVYDKFKTALSNSYIKEAEYQEDYAVWFIDREDGFKMRLMCVCYPEITKKKKSINDLEIFPFKEYGFDEAVVDEIDCKTGAENHVELDAEGKIHLDKLSPGDVRLFFIREKGTDI
ncbi:MAG: hypothetical protein KAS64_05615 [Spirochaetes bacterium]|nr:hypothetical protein [Spirochaetota bacterium]